MKCRHCNSNLEHLFIDLGTSPPSNSFLTEESLKSKEVYYPLRVLVCENCWLVQTEDFANREEFFSEDYVYFSSFSTTWLKHSEEYVNKMISKLDLGVNSLVIEVASNDGYLLQYFKERNIPCLGIEPTKSTAEAAKRKGINTIQEFFGKSLAKKLVNENTKADLMVANNVIAHVPNINDFVQGFATLLNYNGVVTFEFPYLLHLVKYNQFDTIYHEHYSYFSLTTIVNILMNNGLMVYDVENIETHGGSLRVFAQRKDTGKRQKNYYVEEILNEEYKNKIKSLEFYQGFQKKAKKVKNDFLNFLLMAQNENKKVVGYGAAAKGNTLLNYAGIRPDFVPYVIDINIQKQNKFLPGSRIPVVSEDVLKKDKPDYVIIFPWNLKNEITLQLDYIRSWNSKFVIVIPNIEIF
jgi:hypothetical protein